MLTPLNCETSPGEQIRWLIRRDMNEVLEIEKDCFAIPWSEEDFLVPCDKATASAQCSKIVTASLGL